MEGINAYFIGDNGFEQGIQGQEGNFIKGHCHIEENDPRFEGSEDSGNGSLDGDSDRDFELEELAYESNFEPQEYRKIYNKVVDTIADDSNLQFKRLYVCFDALNKGYMEGYRPLIGLDGCFLKGKCKRELLVAVARDPNNQMYPLAWAFVEGENRSSWTSS
ncbi:hypothetical protein Pint_11032 [Pistacia integerrima]|uniref:Uncharacterized protein n=1 Tax=Pistacia integerrima TaxID=434235 RepID=A0ACC0XE80_9ROSI|nr:hypothetical protein Pint_11032 [Pistacia integerrima]